MENKKRIIYADDARAAVLHANPAIAYCIDRVKSVDAVVLPCEIGCEVFYTWSVIDDNDVENFEMSIGKVASFSIQGDGVWAYCRYEDGFTFWHKVLDDFGRVVFLTREEAETALAKMDGDWND